MIDMVKIVLFVGLGEVLTSDFHIWRSLDYVKLREQGVTVHCLSVLLLARQEIDSYFRFTSQDINTASWKCPDTFS